MLTDTHCRNAKPRPKLYRLTDHRGLCLEVKPSGVKAWRYRFTLEGKASMFALGEYPAVSLAEAAVSASPRDGAYRALSGRLRMWSCQSTTVDSGTAI